VELQIRSVRAANKIMIRYTLVARNGTPEKYSISWEARNSFVDREGVAIKEKDSVLSVNGKEKRGFETYVGGGLGAVPYQAKLFDTFVPPEELLPLAQAIARVFAARGEKKNRSRARIKFLIQDLGIEKFKELVLEERKNLPPDPRWTAYVKDADQFHETPLRPGGKAPLLGSESFQRWVKSNTRQQKQEGYVVVTIALPLGDITANQLRALADSARRFTKERIIPIAAQCDRDAKFPKEVFIDAHQLGITIGRAINDLEILAQSGALEDFAN